MAEDLPRTRSGASADPGCGPEPAASAALVRRLRAAGCVYAEEEAALLLAEAVGESRLAAMVADREGGLPLELVLGWAELGGVRVRVEAGVFLPRRRTELMVREAIAVAGSSAGSPVVVDLGCGSGAVGLAVVAGLSGPAATRFELHASDVDATAVRCARTNVGCRGTVHRGDLDESLPRSLRGRVDVLVANVPYVPTGEVPLLPAEARLHEPRRALDGGPDGLRVLARVADVALGWLAPTGSLLVETSQQQAEKAVSILAGAGLRVRVVGDEELGATVLVGRPAAGDRR